MIMHTLCDNKSVMIMNLSVCIVVDVCVWEWMCMSIYVEGVFLSPVKSEKGIRRGKDK